MGQVAIFFVFALSIGDPQDGRGDVVTLSTCGARSIFLIFVHAPSFGDHRDGRGDVATSLTYGPVRHFCLSSPRSALGTPKTAGVM